MTDFNLGRKSMLDDIISLLDKRDQILDVVIRLQPDYPHLTETLAARFDATKREIKNIKDEVERIYSLMPN